MGLSKLENFLGNHIEGFFNKRFASELEPAELARALQKEIAQQADQLKGRTVSNLYVFTLASEDYNRLCAKRVKKELYTVAEKEVIRIDAYMDGELWLEMRQSEALKTGNFELKSGEKAEERIESDEPDTLVLERSSLSNLQPLNLPIDYRTASLTVLQGPDEEAYLEFGERKVYIGRRDKNEFILTDTQASRLHAWIAYERHRHVLYDAQSTNGTYVGGERIEQHVLQDGDEISIGSTLLVYEVI